jgi:acetyl-CoA C-acetyltransferase
MLVASGRAVERHGLQPLARVSAMVSAGVAPRVMGMGPVPATRRLLDRAGLQVGDVDVLELNEAFAAQALAVLRGLGLPDDAEHVNPNGGAIALGHPLGMSGARLALSTALELADRGAARGVVTMCVGVGQGIAVLLEAP